MTPGLSLSRCVGARSAPLDRPDCDWEVEWALHTAQESAGQSKRPFPKAKSIVGHSCLRSGVHLQNMLNIG